MRIVVSDYSGHTFPAELARALAGRGHDVLHLSAASFQTPKGPLSHQPGDPDSLKFEAAVTVQPFAKDTFVRRRFQEVELGREMARRVLSFKPDVVLSGNAPLDAQRLIQVAAKKSEATFVFWVQDVYSEAIERILTGLFGLMGKLIGRHFRRLEAKMLRRSDAIVVIADDFVDALPGKERLDPSRITVIENWAPLKDFPPLERDNAWAARNLTEAPFRFIYSGTLGFKHNPTLLEAVARDTSAQVLVFSEGKAADYLRQAGSTLPNLAVRGWLPFEDLPPALASADVLGVILENDAGVFSVPSKVLTYLAVGRPIVAAVPASNLAARIITGHRAGLVCEPDDEAGFVAAVQQLQSDPALRTEMGENARAYAEHTFDIERISSAFEAIFDKYRGRKKNV